MNETNNKIADTFFKFNSYGSFNFYPVYIADYDTLKEEVLLMPRACPRLYEWWRSFTVSILGATYLIERGRLETPMYIKKEDVNDQIVLT